MSIVIKELEQEITLEKVREDLHTSEMVCLISEINGYDGSFDNLAVYENDEEFFDIHFGNNPMAAIRAAHFGNYSYNDIYVRFNGYNNLESLSLSEYESDFFNEIDAIIDWILDNPDCIDLEYYIDIELLDEYLENY